MLLDVGTPQRIALIKPSALGDVVQALPVVTALRRRFPTAHITWIVNRSYASLLAGHPDLDEVIGFNRGLLKESLSDGLQDILAFLRRVRQSRFDLTIDLQGLFRTGLLSSLTSAEVRIGMSTAREGAAWFYTHRVADDLKEHAVDRYWRVAQALGCDGPKLFRLPRFSAAAVWVEEEFADWPRPWLAVSVGSRWLTKRWPPEHFHELLRRAQAAYGGSVLLVGTRDEKAIAERTCEGLVGPWRNLAGRTTLPQLAALLRSADVVIANDSGPLHLAAALGRPIVAPYTCTQVSRHGPYGQEGRAVASTVACAGSYLRHCGRLDCMNELTADRLWPVLCEILQSWQECLPA